MTTEYTNREDRLGLLPLAGLLYVRVEFIMTPGKHRAGKHRRKMSWLPGIIAAVCITGIGVAQLESQSPPEKATSVISESVPTLTVPPVQNLVVVPSIVESTITPPTTITTTSTPKPVTKPAPVSDTSTATKTAPHGGSGWKAMWAVIQTQFPDARLMSGFRCTDTAYHCKGLAIDIAYPMTVAGKARMMDVDRWIAKTYPGSVQLIHTPGINLLNGLPHVYNAKDQSDHYDHVHWAYVGTL